MYTLGVSLGNLVTIVVGLLSDNVSPRLTAMAGGLMILVSMALLSLASSPGAFAGFMVLSLVGSFCYVPAYTLESYLPKYAPMIITAVTVSCNSSPAIFTVINRVVRATDWPFRNPLYFYGALSAVAGIACGLTFLTKAELLFLRSMQDSANETFAASSTDAEDKHPLLPKQAGGSVQHHAIAKRSKSCLPAWLSGTGGGGGGEEEEKKKKEGGEEKEEEKDGGRGMGKERKKERDRK